VGNRDVIRQAVHTSRRALAGPKDSSTSPQANEGSYLIPHVGMVALRRYRTTSLEVKGVSKDDVEMYVAVNRRRPTRRASYAVRVGMW
jgi:hypothetical protein